MKPGLPPHLRDVTFDGYDDAMWKALLEQAWTQCVDHLKTGGEVRQSFFLLHDVFGRPVVDFIPTRPSEDANDLPRPLVILMVRTILQHTRAPAYLLMTEGWMLSAPLEGLNLENYRHGDVRKRKDRKEALIVQIVTRGGSRFSRTGEIHRLGGVPDEGLVERVEIVHEADKASDVAGAMAELFEEEEEDDDDDEDHART